MIRPFSFTRDLIRNRRGMLNDPRFLTFIVTFACNARCIMCDSWKKSAKDDLSIDEIEKIFSQLPRMDSVRLSGGEPFVRRDMVEIATLVQHYLKPVFLHVTTNGFLPDRIIDFAEKRPQDLPLYFLLSLDGTEEKHNYIRGRDYAWERVNRVLDELSGRKKELNLRVAINQTIVDEDGIEEYRKLKDHLKGKDISHNVVMAYDMSATYNTGEDMNVAPKEIGEFTTFGEFDRGKLLELIDEVDEDFSSLPLSERLAKRYYWRGVRNRVIHGVGDPNPACVALSTHMRLLPNGDVPTCQFNSAVIGNLRKSSFNDVWHGEKAARLRNWVRSCPGCWAECEALPNGIYTGDIITKNILPVKKYTSLLPDSEKKSKNHEVA